MSDIKTGFTGELEDKTGVTAKAKSASRYVKREAGAVAATVQDHPTATGTALLLVGAAAFLAGYLLGSSREEPVVYERRWWS